MAEERDEGKAVQVELRIPQDLHSQYVTNLVVQHTPHEFIVTLFNVYPPIVLGTSEEKKEQLEAVDSVQGQCVARIVISPGRMGEFIQVLQDNHRTWEAKAKAAFEASQETAQ